MSYQSFIVGFATAVVVIIGTALVGAIKGKQMFKSKVDKMEQERQKDKKAIENAAVLDPIKITSFAKVRPGGAKTTNAMPVLAKLVLMGSSLSIYSVSDSEEQRERLMCRVAISQLTASSEKVNPSFKGDVVAGHCLVLQTDEALFTLGGDSSSTSGDAGGGGVGAGGVNEITIKFPTVRELERWINVFSANHTTKEWRKFVKSLPQLDVFNLFLARIFFENRNGPALNELIHKKIAKKLKKVVLPKVISGGLTVDFVSAGDEIPLVSNVSFVSCSTSGEIGFDFDIHYRGGFTLRLLAGLSIRGMSMPPILLTVVIQELRGRVHMSVGPPPSNKMWIGFHEAPHVAIDFKQEVRGDGGLLGAIVSLIPDLSEIVSHIVKIELFEDMVMPNMDDVPLPNVADTPPSSPEEGTLMQPLQQTDALRGVKHHPQWSLDSGASSMASAAATPVSEKPLKAHPLERTASSSSVASKLEAKEVEKKPLSRESSQSQAMSPQPSSEHETEDKQQVKEDEGRQAHREVKKSEASDTVQQKEQGSSDGPQVSERSGADESSMQTVTASSQPAGTYRSQRQWNNQPQW